MIDDESILLQELPTGSGHRLAVVTLNSEATLNSLTLVMIDAFAGALTRWESDPDVVAVVLRGAGDRALAAGGDIQALYRAMRHNADAGRYVERYCDAFFEREYRLDYRLARSRLPVIAWGNGIVMGGGLGLFSAARFRLTTPTSRFGLPEITIGLFPDAGATWLFGRRLAPSMARFLGLTGTNWTAGDALALGLATHHLDPAETSFERLVSALQDLAWSIDSQQRLEQTGACLAALASPPPEPGELARRSEAIAGALSEGMSVDAALAALAALADADEWFTRPAAALRAGCPTTAGIVLHQVSLAPTLSLAESFRFEWTVAAHCARNGEFVEGVRALLIDKDRKPQWQHPFDRLSETWVNSHFDPLPGDHPLADLD